MKLWTDFTTDTITLLLPHYRQEPKDNFYGTKKKQQRRVNHTSEEKLLHTLKVPNTGGTSWWSGTIYCLMSAVERTPVTHCHQLNVLRDLLVCAGRELQFTCWKELTQQAVAPVRPVKALTHLMSLLVWSNNCYWCLTGLVSVVKVPVLSYSQFSILYLL